MIRLLAPSPPSARHDQLAQVARQHWPEAHGVNAVDVDDVEHVALYLPNESQATEAEWVAIVAAHTPDHDAAVVDNFLANDPIFDQLNKAMASTEPRPVSRITFMQGGPTVSFGTNPTLVPLSELAEHRLLKPSVDKLRWANHHLLALEQDITTFESADPSEGAQLRAELDPETGEHVYRVSLMPDLREFDLLCTHSIADTAGALRSSLDKLAWNAATDFAAGRPPDPAGVKFIIATTRDEWTKAGRARKAVSPLHCGFIESFQPYHGQDGRSDSWSGEYVHPLALLQDLTNDDKHRDTHPVFLMPRVLHLIPPVAFVQRPVVFGGLKVSTTDDCTFCDETQDLKTGAEVMRARLVNAEPVIDPAGACFPQVALPEGPATHTLNRLLRFTHLILSEFARQFPSN